MNIQFNTDKHMEGTETFKAPFLTLIAEELNKYSSYISRINVHISDENGDKPGPCDKRCLLEARLEGRKPIAVINLANSNETAIAGAIEKLKIDLEKIVLQENSL